MTPWVYGFAANDQYTPWSTHYVSQTTTRKQLLLPWQSFPSRPLYGCLVATVGLVFAGVHMTLDEIESVDSWHSSGLVSAIIQDNIWIWTFIGCCCFGVIFSASVFVAFMYWHCRACSTASSKKANCTKFVKFRNPVDQMMYSKEPIDMETLYEMYFDEKLDFIMPLDSNKEGEPCLMNDILTRRNEFVTYTFGLTTHLWFLISQWIPAVLTHSKGQDKEQVRGPLVFYLLSIQRLCTDYVFAVQVRDHYDRSKFYAEKSDAGQGTDGNDPFTSDEAEDDFFGMFLGHYMVYTSGICSGLSQQHPESLEQMQENKLRLICNKLKLNKGDTHLDIGCGWGTLINHSVSKHGTIGTGVTLSRNQCAYATVMSKKLKIRDHRTTFWCRDYRDIPTNVGVKYNKISCIEMAEHVGVKNFQTFLYQVRELLEDDGIFLLQIAGLRRAFQVRFFLVS